MSNTNPRIDELRERLTGVLAEWGTEMSSLLAELAAKSAELEQIKKSTDDRDGEIEVLEQSVQGQAELIETLKAEAEETVELRNEVRAKDLDLERLSSELESKQELVRALRRDAETVDRLKGEAKVLDRELDEAKKDRRRAEKAAQDLRAELEALKESADDESSGGLAELEAMQAELEARKTLIKSLRADAERTHSLASQLEEKRSIVSTLEASINRHVATIAELKRGADMWKRKYKALQGGDTSTTSTELPAFNASDVTALQQLEAADVEHTIAIDMRQPLREARLKSTEGRVKR
jgi:chromosome segregation ATPase